MNDLYRKREKKPKCDDEQSALAPEKRYGVVQTEALHPDLDTLLTLPSA